MFKIPPLSADLIEALRKDYPQKSQGILHNMNTSDLAYYAGQQSVVEMLERMLYESAESSSVLDGPNVL